MTAVRYLSVCSGIEAASVAWEPLGWVPVAFAEIEKFPSTVLKLRWPHVPNLGDMTKINGTNFKGNTDVLVGGTPCQSFSVAGLRGGLDDERGNLALEFVRIADESDPAFVIWENVPGIFSDRGNAFGCFLAALAGEKAPLLPPGGKWTNAGYVLGPRRTIAWRVLDAQYFGLAQRRKRVYVIACPRDGANPCEILFEFDGMRRDSPPSRKTGERTSGTIESCLGRSRGAGTSPADIVSHGDVGEPVPSLTQNFYADDGTRHGLLVPQLSSVRRLTPVECERLQGFPDNHTAIPWSRAYRHVPLEVLVRSYRKYLKRTERQGKHPLPFGDVLQCADGPRYKTLGNSMPTKVMNWLGRRIERYRQQNGGMKHA